jgi:tetratricopeptide (TPR) repeat protein
MGHRAFVSRFSPNRTDPAVLEAIFVQRHKLAEDWLERLRDSVLTEVKHHLLAVGPRGCGKSHLATLLVHRLLQDPAVAERVRVAKLPEDEMTPSFWKFLLRILRALNAEYGDEFPPAPRQELAEATDERRSAVLIDYLLKHLGSRTLLVVVENLDDVMRGLKDEGQKRWRAFLQEHKITATLATSQQLTEEVSEHDKPFFNFFQIEHLKPLTADEATTLLRKLAELSGSTDLATFLQTSTGRARVRAIRHLAGGSHRVFIILSEFATRENLDDLVCAFEELLDDLTPYYQERLRSLPDQQREIVEFLCRQARTVPVKEIARELFLGEQTSAAQLKSLKDKGYVTSGNVGRESRYELAEPLMRLCIEVKEAQREPIPLIVDFLRVWYERKQFELLCEQVVRDSDLRRYIDAVLHEYEGNSADLAEVALDHDWEVAKESGDAQEIGRVAREIITTTTFEDQCFIIGYELEQLNLDAEAAEAFDRATELDPTSWGAWLAKGMTLNKLGRYADALEAFDQVSKSDEHYAIGRLGRGAALSELGQHEEALAVFSEVIEHDPKAFPAWIMKGLTLKTANRHREAIGILDRAIQLDPNSATVWQLKGETLSGLERYGEALEAFERAAQLQPNNARLWFQKGNSLFQLGRREEALGAFDRATELEPERGTFWGVKGLALVDLERAEEALASFDRAIKLEPDCALGWDGKGIALHHLGRHEEALAAFHRVIELEPENASAWLHQGVCRLNLGDDPGGIADARHALVLSPGYHQAAEILARPLARQGKWEEAWSVLEGPFRESAPEPLTEQDRDHLPDLLATLFESTTARALWTERVGRLVAIYAAGKALPNLGTALVRSLEHLDSEEVSASALDSWAQVWREITERYPDLSLSVRLFGVGVRYVQTKDERGLLDLVQEERAILRDLFGLDTES